MRFMTKNNPKLVFWSGIIGNALDHYDIALYAFMAPFIAPIFFNEGDGVVKLIMAYGLATSTGLISRPIGAFLFGKMAMSHGPKKVLITTLAGVSISTVLLGLTPGYSDIGALAPIFLIIIRVFQGIFASGEHTVSSLFIMDHVKPGNYARASSYYLVSTMAGLMIASWAATWVSSTSDPAYYWRYPFFGAIFTGIVGIILRSLVKDSYEDIKKPEVKDSELIKINGGKLVRIILVNSFSYMTYAVPFIFLNTFIPELQPNITTQDMLTHNSLLLMLDVVLLLIAGFISEKFPYHKWMAIMSFLVCITAVPVFSVLQTASLTSIVLVRLWFIVLGVAFAAPLKAWFFKMLSGDGRYLVLGIGYAVGSEILGRSTTVICWALWHNFHNLLAPALYITILSAAATVALLYKNKEIS